MEQKEKKFCNQKKEILRQRLKKKKKEKTQQRSA